MGPQRGDAHRWGVGGRTVRRSHSRRVFWGEYVSSRDGRLEGGADGVGGSVARGRLHAAGHAMDDAAPAPVWDVRDSAAGLPGTAARGAVAGLRVLRLGGVFALDS